MSEVFANISLLDWGMAVTMLMASPCVSLLTYYLAVWLKKKAPRGKHCCHGQLTHPNSLEKTPIFLLTFSLIKEK